jgi:hypothetical protein
VLPTPATWLRAVALVVGGLLFSLLFSQSMKQQQQLLLLLSLQLLQ